MVQLIIPPEAVNESFINGFKQGVKYANSKWKERMRWKSLKEEPPKIEDGKCIKIILKDKYGELEADNACFSSYIDEYVKDGFYTHYLELKK